MRNLVLLAACALAISVGLASCDTLTQDNEGGDNTKAKSVNQRAMDEIVGIITGKQKSSGGEDDKRGASEGRDRMAAKRVEETKGLDDVEREKAIKKQKEHAREVARAREQVKKDRMRILGMIQDDKIERKYNFDYVETTTLSPEQLEVMRTEEEQLKEKGVAQKSKAANEHDEKRKRDLERVKQYANERKRDRALLQQQRNRIKDFIEADKGERKHRFMYPDPTDGVEKTLSSGDEIIKIRPSVCKLTLKFPDGTTKLREYSPSEHLASIRLYVRLLNPTVQLSKISLVKGDKQYTGPMMKESFESLGLCPESELDIKLN